MNPVYELVKKYYPRLWGKDRIDALVAKGRLTEEEAAEVLPDGQEEDADGHD